MDLEKIHPKAESKVESGLEPNGARAQPGALRQRDVELAAEESDLDPDRGAIGIFLVLLALTATMAYVFRMFL